MKQGYWHTMEVLSLPWHADLGWPNTTMFKQNKVMLEKRLDNMYFNSSTIFSTLKYVRSVVMKFEKGKYQLQHLTSSTTTSTTTTSTSTTTTIPKRGKRQLDEEDSTEKPMIPREFRDCPQNPNKTCYGAKGYWPYMDEGVFSTAALVEHQFMEVSNEMLK